MPQVDVIVPCYDYGRYLRDCVDSVLRQSHEDVRVLIIDDASPDNTAEVAAKLSEDTRVCFVMHKVNRGHIATYNEGLNWANGDYLLLLSADDLLAPGALRRAVAVMEANPAVGLTFGACIDIGSNDSIPFVVDDPGEDSSWDFIKGPDFIANACRIAGNVVPTPTAIVRTCLQKRIGGYLPPLVHAGDTHMWLRFAARATVARTTALQGFKREHGRNMSADFYARLVPDYKQRRAVFEALFEEYGATITGSVSLHAQARKALAEDSFWHGVGKLLEGRTSLARELLDFAYSTCPELRFRPPVGRLFRMRRISRKAWVTTRGLLSHIGEHLAT